MGIVSANTDDHGCRLLKVPELADRYGVCDKSIYNWIAAGYITAVRMGRGIRIAVAEADRFIAEGGTKKIPRARRTRRRGSK